MPIEIDQSWKLEFTNKQTVLADSLGHAITISSQDKKRLKTYFRIMNKRKMYINQTFAILLAYLIINTFTQTQQYIIDIDEHNQRLNYPISSSTKYPNSTTTNTIQPNWQILNGTRTRLPNI